MVAIQDIINNQYPHFLYVRNSGEEALQDANGSWQTTGAAWKLHASCREETNGKGTSIQAANGRFITFASLIQLPAGTERVGLGTGSTAADREPATVRDLPTKPYRTHRRKEQLGLLASA